MPFRPERLNGLRACLTGPIQDAQSMVDAAQHDRDMQQGYRLLEASARTLAVDLGRATIRALTARAVAAALTPSQRQWCEHALFSQLPLIGHNRHDVVERMRYTLNDLRIVQEVRRRDEHLVVRDAVTHFEKEGWTHQGLRDHVGAVTRVSMLFPIPDKREEAIVHHSLRAHVVGIPALHVQDWKFIDNGERTVYEAYRAVKTAADRMDHKMD